jgi:hypothetical protein
MAICNRNCPVQQNVITAGLAKENKRATLLSHSKQLVGSIKQEDLS